MVEQKQRQQIQGFNEYVTKWESKKNGTGTSDQVY